MSAESGIASSFVQHCFNGGFCEACANQLSNMVANCPICREPINGIVRIFNKLHLNTYSHLFYDLITLLFVFAHYSH